jgi:hypothetical protein
VILSKINTQLFEELWYGTYWFFMDGLAFLNIYLTASTYENFMISCCRW